MPSGYTRYPAIHGERLAFVAADDLWIRDAPGAPCRRLVTGMGGVRWPRFAPDGARLALSATHEGAREVWVVDARGGPPRRRTWLGDDAWVAGWDGADILYTSAAGQPFASERTLSRVPADRGVPEDAGWGPVVGVALGSGGRAALCRFQDDLSRWKRYRGGRVGTLWVRREADAEWVHLEGWGGNLCAPMWIGERLWFVGDHEGTGNLYSCLADGSDLRRHTDHDGFYVRHPTTDGTRVAYTCGADLYVLDPDGDGPERQELELLPHRTPRHFPRAGRYLDGYALHPEGHSLVLVVRGRPVVLGNWEGPARELGVRGPARYRLARFLPDGARIALVSDAGGDERIEVHDAGGGGLLSRLDVDLGRVTALVPSPTDDLVAVTTHRHELWIASLSEGTAERLDASEHGPMGAPAWSPDGRWLAWVRPERGFAETTRVRLCSAADRVAVDVTSGAYRDLCPSFDPDGTYLYFLSHRELDPVYDNIVFDLGFPRGVRPYLVVLRERDPHPFRPAPRPLKPRPGGAHRPPATSVDIDLEELASRVVQFPVAEGRYSSIVGLPGGRVLLTRGPLAGGLGRRWFDPGPPKDDQALYSWDFDTQELTLVNARISSFTVDQQGRTLCWQAGARLRVALAHVDRSRRELLRKTSGAPGRSTGWIALDRVRIEVEPRIEWAQIFEESWRLMRDQFWTEDMGGVDWEDARARYHPLLETISTRSELSDLIWRMQGELGTSHAYEIGGDYGSAVRVRLGHLGATVVWDDEREGYRFAHIAVGEPGDPKRSGPLRAPGARVREGEVLLAIDGTAVGPDRPVGAHLAHRAGQLVELTVADADGQPRRCTVRPLADCRPLRYRDWVLANRERAHARADGRIGYVHIPDMGPSGYAEFHRDLIAESDREALLVDVRYNRGGHVSQLLLAKLARRRLGYKVSRWMAPTPYPRYAVEGPMLCLANERAGSDGDIFCQAWKLLELGPLLGTRTWGGVVGIWPRHPLVDRSVATQPEFHSWLLGEQFGLENRGAVPDEEVHNGPATYEAGVDAQLETALRRLEDLLPATAADRPRPPPA